jgi:ATP-dependent protease ClpP protease subunit
MAKQILLYNSIYSSSAADFMGQLDMVGNKDCTIRVNCPGGDPYSTYGMIAKVTAMDNCRLSVDGMANSCAAYMVAAKASSKTTECLAVSTFVFHRAATWMEKYVDMMTPEVKAELENINAVLRGIIEDSCGAAAWQAVTGVSLDDMFSMDARKDVRINAEQAKRLGFVAKINPLTETRKTEIMALSNQYGIAAFAGPVEATTTSTSQNTPVMAEIKTLAELEKQSPELHAEAMKAGAESERQRIRGWNAWAHVDAEAVKKGIESGERISPEDVSEFSAKACAPEFLEALKKGNVTVQTDKTGTEGNQPTEADMFQANAKAMREGKDLPYPNFK